jgi:hypothetical protein
MTFCSEECRKVKMRRDFSEAHKEAAESLGDGYTPKGYPEDNDPYL